MPVWIGDIAPILMIAGVAILAGAHAIVSWSSYELALHTVRLDARRLHEQMERRRAAMLDDDLVEDLTPTADGAPARAA